MQRYGLKLVLMGDTRVGKSQLSRAFVNKNFLEEAQVTVGIEFTTKMIEFEKSIVQAQIWDTAGQERLQNMTKTFYRNTAGAVLVYDVCNKKSFENLQNVWLKQLREQGYSDVRLILVGNKVDLLSDGHEREVSQEEAIEFARQENMDFFETSALKNYCVDDMFRRISLSIARGLPQVAVHLEVSYLPDGWMACADDSADAANAASDISVDDIQAAMADEMEKSKGPVSVSTSPASLGKKSKISNSSARIKSPLTVNVPPQKYINYWTGECVKDQPTAPASMSEGMLYCAREVLSMEIDPISGRPLDKTLNERTSSCKTSSTFISNSSRASYGERRSSDQQEPNYDLHESRRSLSRSKSSSSGGQGCVEGPSFTRCLRSSCVIC